MFKQVLILSCVLLSCELATAKASWPAFLFDDESIAIPPPAKKCSAVTSTECTSDPCCNWCGSLFNASVGFCLPFLPTPIPSLVCHRETPICGAHDTLVDCAGSAMCKWVPAGPLASPKGVCVYDWDACKAPVASPFAIKPLRAIAAAPPPKPVPPPAPKLSCNMTTQADCDAKSCCQWCGPAVGPGFCLPVIEWPIPTLTCSKAGASCTALLSSAQCEASDMCSWHPFGPPGVAGPGICTFDVIKCAAR